MASFFVWVILSLATLSINPPLCTGSLRSYPNALKDDLRASGQIVATKAITATEDVLDIAKSKSGGPASDCVETSGAAIANLNECVNYLKSTAVSSKSDLQTKASAALTNVVTCDDEFRSSEPADLKAATKKAQDLIKELLVIVNNL